MAKIKLGRGEPTEYGTRYDGRVVDGRRSINITYRTPHAAEDADTVYINANGLSAGKATMRLGAIIGAHAGHKTVTVDYTNRFPKKCLDSNAKDIAIVAEAFSDDHHKRLIGLSEGGAVAVRAMLLTKVHAASLINPAGIIAENNLSWREGLNLVSSVVPEVAGYMKKDPVGTLLLGASCLANCVKRPGGVIGEMNELRHGNEHDNLHAIKQAAEAPHVRICWSQADNLLKGALLEAGAQLLPVDDRVTFAGGHCDWASDPVLAHTIYQRDHELFGAPAYLLGHDQPQTRAA